jgi:uncharacterized protein (TIGR03032 family)
VSIDYEYTFNWSPILGALGSSLLVSAYQTGRVFAISRAPGAEETGLRITSHRFEKAMGIAASRDRLAIVAKSLVWILRDAPEIAPGLDPAGTYDACFLARGALYTGPVSGHELVRSGEELWLTNTLFSCLCTLDDRHSFIPRWRPRFISRLAAEDRCHLNGLAMDEGQPRYVTVFGTTDTPGGWRPGKVGGGCLIDVRSGEVVASGLAMPHSPRVHDGAVWLLDSGRGRLVRVDVADGSVETVAELPGYTRGLALAGEIAFVGLSMARESATFAGLPVAERYERLKCGVAIVDLPSGQTVGLLEFRSEIEEIFDVQLVAGVRSPMLQGPYPDLDEQAPIWLGPAWAVE